MTSKILKQDIVSALKKNLTESNIDVILAELKNSTRQNISVKLMNKGYKLYEAFLNCSNNDLKCCGFGRTKFEALSNSLINMIEALLETNENIDAIKESLKSLTIKEKEQTVPIKQFRNTQRISIDNEESETKALVNMLTNTKELILCHEEDFTVFAEYRIDLTEYISMKKDYEEKKLIINELEGMIVDMLGQLKKINEFIEKEVEVYPDYFKCPISWEKIENPVVSSEGHSYEKWAIDKWLHSQDTSPITGLFLSNQTLIPNYALKSAIDDYIRRITKWRKRRNEIMKYVTKSEYDLNDLKKYF
jgi:hypothetical protein